MRQNQGIVGRLAVDNAVGFQTAHYRLDRAIASAFLVTHGGNCHIARQLIPGILQKLYRHHRCHQTALHIRAAASVHLAIPITPSNRPFVQPSSISAGITSI